MVAQMWYFVKCIYFGLSAYQIRCGYPTRILGNFLTKGHNYANLFLFQGFRMVPFLTELRAVMDWVWTDTSLSLSSWICVEDIYAHIFILKCWRESEKKYPQPRGQKKKAVVKYGMGGMIVALLICIVWFPLLFMSLVKSVAGVVNTPLDVSFAITLAGFTPIFTMSAQQKQLQNVNLTEFDSYRLKYKDNDTALQWLERYFKEDLIIAELKGSSNSLWTISPPSRNNLIEMLSSNEDFPITVAWSVQRYFRHPAPCRGIVNNRQEDKVFYVVSGDKRTDRSKVKGLCYVCKEYPKSDSEMVTIFIKYFFQFGFFPFNQNPMDKSKPYHPPNIIGVEKKDGYVHYDLVQLLALFFHRSILKCHGLWDEEDPKERRAPSCQSESEDEGKSKSEESEKGSERASSMMSERGSTHTLRSLNFGASIDSGHVQVQYPQQQTFQRRKSSSGGSHISHRSLHSTVRSKRGSTASHHSSHKDGSEASVHQKTRKQMITEKLREQLLKGKAFIIKRLWCSEFIFNFEIVCHFQNLCFSYCGFCFTLILGLYASVVLVIGKFVREFFSGISHTIMFEELPNVDRIHKLCTDIFLVRETGELDLEEDMYAKLIFLYRSPETMIKWTREKTE
ncbi:piezo-type mechanosensitive ion channel component 2-like [Notothenia coriiceps]|uniref:Piezo-type mechanosensitive ion channel component 2-like n=1 Tax=Notothenia coriiceps TaxID=8208 RepID=A0A6I9MWS8_9TELE|nr:PREDICTED: piezo-type mechanosensitive ion channel component 2-like [Notothenia coriiceps]